MSSSADRFTRLEKVAVFLIALGEERTREILADVDLETVERLNASIRGLVQVTAEEKASVMLEFAHFFYADEPIQDLQPPTEPPTPGLPKTADPEAGAASFEIQPLAGETPQSAPARERPDRMDDAGAAPPRAATQTGAAGGQSDEERAILQTLEKLRQHLDPGKVDWGRAGYDFGEGFKGPDARRR